MPSMKFFAESFFRSFGARIEPHGDEWVVDLLPDLAEVFGAGISGMDILYSATRQRSSHG